MNSEVRGRRFQQNLETDDLGLLRSSKILATSVLVALKWESTVASVFVTKKLHVLCGSLHELREARQRLLPLVTHSCSLVSN